MNTPVSPDDKAGENSWLWESMSVVRRGRSASRAGGAKMVFFCHSLANVVDVAGSRELTQVPTMD